MVWDLWMYGIKHADDRFDEMKEIWDDAEVKK